MFLVTNENMGLCLFITIFCCGSPAIPCNDLMACFCQVYEIYPADLHLDEKLKQVAKRDGHSEESKRVSLSIK